MVVTAIRSVLQHPAIAPPRPRAIEGGTDGDPTAEATLAKRKEIAAIIRQDAATLNNPSNPMPEMLRLAESLVYDNNADAAKEWVELAGQYCGNQRQLPPDKLAAKKDEVKHLYDICKFLARFNVIADDAPPKVKLEEFIKEHNWDKK